jgi:probable DNA metabolism protein
MKTPENFMEYLSAHRDCTEELLDDARMLSVEDLETGTDPKTVKIRRMVSAVRLEIHRMRGFVRLVPLADDISCGYMEPEHDTGRFIAQSLAHRFPNTEIILGNDQHTWRSRYSAEGMTYSEGAGMRETMEELEKYANSLSQKSDTEKLWRTYYISQYSPERKNLTLFKKHMPEKHMDAAGLLMERTAENMPLASFC